MANLPTTKAPLTAIHSVRSKGLIYMKKAYYQRFTSFLCQKKEQQIDSDFLTVFFDTNRWHKGVAERAAEGARNHGLLNISAEDFFDIDLSVPKDVAEQKQIGAFIRQLDDLITLHQREWKGKRLWIIINCLLNTIKNG